jgi:hypothetical protein
VTYQQNWWGPKNVIDFSNRGAKKLILKIERSKIQKYHNRGSKVNFSLSYISSMSCNAFTSYFWLDS